ncbi:MAG: hypothetical protein NVSMB5_26430 [Candidatus Velthaea sp.]
MGVCVNQHNALLKERACKPGYGRAPTDGDVRPARVVFSVDVRSCRHEVRDRRDVCVRCDDGLDGTCQFCGHKI